MILKIDSIATVSFNPSMSLANEYKCALNLSYTKQEASEQSLKKYNGGNSNKKRRKERVKYGTFTESIRFNAKGNT